MALALVIGVSGCPGPAAQDDPGDGPAAHDDDDGSGIDDEDEVPVENRAPLADAGDDRLVPVGERVALHGGGSSDADGDALAFAWAFAEVPSGSAVELSAADVLNPSFTPDVPGVYVAKLSVDDGGAASAPDLVEITAVERERPTASAGPDGSILLDETFALDGSGSAASGGGPLSFRWRLVDPIAGSAAALAGSDAEVASFSTDTLGSYLVELIVSEEGLESAPDFAYVSVFEAYEPPNHVPVAIFDAAGMVALGGTVEVDGSPSFDPDQDPLTFSWTLTAPEGSAASASGQSDESWSFAADLPGDYELSLTVSDGELTSAPFTLTVTAGEVTGPPSGDVIPFSFLVADAEYSRALNRLVLLSDTAEVKTVDIASDVVESVALPLQGTAISVSRDGTRAVVGHDGYVTELTLSPLAVVVTHPVAAICGDVVMGDGFAYCFPAIDQWVDLHSVNLTTGAETTGDGWSLRAGTIARMHPSGERMYGADNGVSPSDIERYDVGANGVASVTRDSPYHGDYAMCGDLWLFDDGTRMLTACGNVFRASNDSSLDMTYNGSIDVTGVGHADHSSAAGRLAVVVASPGWWQDPVDESVVQLFESGYLNAQDPITLPPFPLQAGDSAASHGRFVFFSSSGAELTVIVQAESGSGAAFDFGYTVLRLSTP